MTKSQRRIPANVLAMPRCTSRNFASTRNGTYARFTDVSAGRHAVKASLTPVPHIAWRRAEDRPP